MGKLKFALLVGFLVVVGGFVCDQRQASAYSCNVHQGPCGYFTDKSGSADDNVLPDPALKNSPDMTNKNTPYADQFIGAILWYLYRKQNDGQDTQAHIGAAFIIDSMLGYKGGVGVPAGGGKSAGYTYAKDNFQTAKDNFQTWQALVYFYANSKDTSQYGVKWSVTPSKKAFCGTNGGNIDSGYDPNLADAVLYLTPKASSSNCDYEYTHSMPEIEFYWQGGSFDIGKLCGNIQDSANPIPQQNHAPMGQMMVSCDSNGDYTAAVQVKDQDGPTTGTLTDGAGFTVASIPSGTVVPIPQSVTSKPPVTLYLYAQDVGSVASGNNVQVATATLPSCSCAGSLATTPSYIDPYMKYTLTVDVTASGGQASGTPTMQLTVVAPAGGKGENVSAPSVPKGGGWEATFTGLGAPGQTGTYTANWSLGTGTSGVSCSGRFEVVDLPYLNVYGGDVMAGSSPSYNGSASSCVTNANAGAFSWNNHATDFSGAGAQYAVQTLAAIQDFASSSDPSNSPPISLSFANTYTPFDASKVNPIQGLFGGYFGVTTNDCDFTSDITTAQVSGTAATSQIASLPGQLSNGSTTIYASGDVYISRNIVYSTVGWTDVSKIPYFRLIVTGGDIYIDHSVSQLDGLYVAEPLVQSNGTETGGRIYTCATGLGVAVDPTLGGSYSTCSKQLVINGAFVARYVAFGRTYGTLGEATSTDTVSSNHDAEVFNYTPELWLPRSDGAPSGAYAAITGLPPVL